MKTCAFVLNFYTCTNSDPNLNVFPRDVISHGQQHGLIGVNNWPLYTAEQVHNLIDELADEYCEDFNRVFIFNQFTLFKSNST